MTGEAGGFEIRGVSKVFSSAGGGWFGKKSKSHALRDVTLTIPRLSSFGVVGESGSGKSTLARILAGLSRPTSGTVLLHGKEVAEWVRKEPKEYYQSVQMVFQNPSSSLNPRHRVRTILSHPLRLLAKIGDEERREAVMKSLLQEVGLPEDALDRFPHEFSGGQAQRIAIARALAAEPSVLILDEATSALDVSVQAQILELLRKLQNKHSWTLVFIGHDLAVVRHLCSHVAVLRGGRLVETGEVESVLREPKEEYTRTLLESSPRLM